ncbi:ATP synthase F1 subunit gamma [Sporomusa acidovorans]|uniref:ATP synthase gamma chain n=1 Tax=Sporomusa acidovorans (strain ATCC 49682 / DSM 3132 / Mol) TaxID=1123286 RepID=A0ABZ3J9D7_SPOA4|nr:ATP synthase F1 subunit gamma [Sporomusa acidovorans]OZC16058.1 ATP synthase gamma chain, sodium ion specific [Sporomusa acidovorans DSM 3132]SDD88114.1 F-type H+-transporting ATPase subunit gamma [Sporomusa acidovorans]
MANALDLRRRIKGIKNIQKITQAMKMVAAVRLRKAQERVKDNHPYCQGLETAIVSVLNRGEDIRNQLFSKREVFRTGYLVIGADKGLAGSYGSNLGKAVQYHIGGNKHVGLVVVGRKVRDYFERRKVAVDKAYLGISEKPHYRYARDISTAVTELFTQGKYDRLYLVYTRFCSPAVQQVAIEPILPIAVEADSDRPVIEQIYDPSFERISGEVVAKWLEAMVYRALIHAAASEVAARLHAMSLATDNAQDLISQLVLAYNKVRQANITREITEIVGGAEALR